MMRTACITKRRSYEFLGGHGSTQEVGISAERKPLGVWGATAIGMVSD